MSNKIIDTCRQCKAMIGEGEEYYDIEGRVLCVECGDQWLYEWTQRHRRIATDGSDV